MSVSEIDILQTEQIEALQDDVKELRDILNLIVTDITHATNGITKKLNDAIYTNTKIHGIRGKII